MEGLDRVPWKGELGQRIYENVSKEAWKMWIEHSKMIMNEYRLNPLDPQSQKIMEEQLEQFFFGEGAKLPEGYIPPASERLRPGLSSIPPTSLCSPGLGHSQPQPGCLCPRPGAPPAAAA